jgi:TP901 family phage tail tape measure protein
MATKIENRGVNLFIQTGDAQRAYDALTAKQKKFNDELATATNPKRIQVLKDELKKLEEPIDRAGKKMRGELDPSLKNMETTVARLRNELILMSKQDKDYDKKVAQYKQATAELEAQRGKVGLLSRAWKSFWQEAKTVAVGVIIGNTLQSALQTVMGYVSGIVTGSAKIADELADIEKTTGLSTNQVKELNKELGKIDTRTSRSDLRKLAEEAGKLGKETTPEIIKFVDAADKIRVALGKDLGDDAVISIGKLSKIFNEEMLNIGSAINEVGANSEASERFAVDFLNRVAGVGPAVKLSAADLLGYGAALEIAGQTAEVSGTALNTFLVEFVRDSEKFGKAAGFAKGELTNLINDKGTNEALLTFLQRLKDSSPTTSAFLEKMKELGVDGARGANVLLALSNNIKNVKDQQLVANEAIKSNNSIMTEFNKKNNNAAAELDKFRKNLAGLFQSESFQQAGAAAIRLMTGFINLIKASAKFISEHGGLIATLGIIYAAATVRIKGATIATALWNTLTAAGNIISRAAAAAMIIYRTVLVALEGQIKAVSAAQMIWRTVMSLGAGPLGVLLVGVGALVVGVQALLGNTKKLTTEQKLQADISAKVAESTAEQVQSVKTYLSIAKDEKESLDNRKKALDALIKQSPDYLKGLTLQNLETAEGKRIIDNYIQSLQKKAEAEAKSALFSENIKRRQEQLTRLRANVPELAGLSDDQVFEELNKQLSKLKVKAPISSITIGGIKLSDLKEVSENIKILEGDIKKITTEALKSAGTGGIAGADTVFDIMTASVDELRKKLKELNSQLNPQNKTTILPQIDAIKKRIKELLGGGGNSDKTLKDLKALQEELRQITFLQGAPDAQAKEIFELDNKFAKLREQAKGNVKLLSEIDNLYLQELANLFAKFDIQRQAAIDKQAAADKAKYDASARAQAEIIARVYENLGKQLAIVFQRTNRDKLAKAEVDVLQSSGKRKLQAELKLLEEQKRQELLQKDLTENEKLLTEKKFQQKRKEAEMNYWTDFVQTILSFTSQALNIAKIFGDAATQRENNELARDQRANDKKKKNLEGRLKAGAISQAQYNREIERLDLQRERKEKELRTRQFNRDKKQQLANAAVNTAGAVLTTLQKFGPPIPPNFLGIAAMALTVLTGVAQVLTISRQKPPEFGTGGKLKGPAHTDASRGMPVTNPYTGHVHAYLEGDEGIINKFSMRDKKSYTVTGTPSQIASKLNSYSGRGVNWESGATLIPSWSTRKAVPINFPAINRYYATGGVFDSTSTNNAGVEFPSADKLATVVDRLERRLHSIEQNGIAAYTLLSQNEKQQARRDAILEDGTMK